MTTFQGIFFYFAFVELLLFCVLGSGLQADAVKYDYNFTAECVDKPLNPQYGGGLLAVAANRTKPFDQRFYVEKDRMYAVSAWIKLSSGTANVAAKIKAADGLDFPIGWTSATSSCWSMLKGGFLGNFSGLTQLYFESHNSSIEIWEESISIQPFSVSDWKSHQQESIEKSRKSRVKLQAIDSRGQPVGNATISIEQTEGTFALGNAMSPHILTNVAYRTWHNARFKLTVFENELKWHVTEPSQGQVDYHLADAMLEYCKNYSMVIRGHNIVWENQYWLPSWAKTISQEQLRAAIRRRFLSIIPKYKGQMIHWDVDNENMHFSYVESMLGEGASARFYQAAHNLDNGAVLFLNEFNTIENPYDGEASPAIYLAKIREIRSTGFNGPLGIGLQGHFDTPILPYIRAAIDILATARLPIWITELDVSARPEQAEYLNDILWELLAHPAVTGIMIWSPWQPQGCYKMCLTDNSFYNLPTGDVVDNFMGQVTHHGLVGTTDENGYFDISLFHGNYQVTIKHPDVIYQSSSSFNVAKERTLVKISI